MVERSSPRGGIINLASGGAVEDTVALCSSAASGAASRIDNLASRGALEETVVSCSSAASGAAPPDPRRVKGVETSPPIESGPTVSALLRAVAPTSRDGPACRAEQSEVLLAVEEEPVESVGGEGQANALP